MSIFKKPSYTQKTTGMVINVEKSVGTFVLLTVKYVVGDSKYFLNQRVDTSLHKIEDVDIGNVFEVMYDKKDPNKAKIQKFEIQ